MNNIEEKIKNIKEWNEERARIKPLIDVAIDFHNKAMKEMQSKNFEKAAEFFKEAISNYRNAVNLKPRYYLADIMERIDNVLEEHTINVFNSKIAGDNLKTEKGVKEFVEFVENLNSDERQYIKLYDIALNYLRIADLYYEERNMAKAYEFYNRVIAVQCGRYFLDKSAYFKIGKILFEQKKFKEALMSFVSVLSFDRNNKDTISYIDKCLKELKIPEHRGKFLTATPNQAKKLIMEVL